MSSHGSLDTEAARALLAQVLRDPFGSGAVSDWLDLLARHFRLWSFERYAFLGRQTSELPTTHPLPLFVESILRDEGIKPDEELDRLATTLDQRRLSLAYGGAWRSTHEVLPAARCRLHMVVDLTRPTAEEEVYLEGDYLDFVPPNLQPYVTLGQTLVQVIEAREQARAVGEEEALKEANESVDKFLKQIAAKLGAGRPAAGLTKKLALPLVREGRDLLSLCWDQFPFEVSEETDQLLADFCTQEDERNLWAARLALPLLSTCELLALKAEREERDLWKPRQREPYPTPVRLAVWVVAHRLGLNAATVTRKARDHDAKYFTEYLEKHEGKDPFDRHC